MARRTGRRTPPADVTIGSQVDSGGKTTRQRDRIAHLLRGTSSQRASAEVCFAPSRPSWREAELRTPWDLGFPDLEPVEPLDRQVGSGGLQHLPDRFLVVLHERLIE